MTKEADRATDLLVDRVTEGLDPELERELDELLARCPEIEPESFELAAAAIELTATDASEPMPAALRQRVAHQAHEFFREQPGDNAEPVGSVVPITPRVARRAPMRESSSPSPARRRSDSARWLGWLAAAAILITALGLWPRAERQLTPAGARSQMIAQAEDVLRLEWSATEDPAGQGASGDIVWSTARQEGYMSFNGLAVNDPTVEQYQLWIFDAEQDEKYPVDGGVFDITSEGEVVVEIDSRLAISQPTLFAITIEKPGGVVVSSRERLPLLAQIG